MAGEALYRIVALLLTVALFGISGYYRRKASREGGALNPAGGKMLVVLRGVGLLVVFPFLIYLVNPAWVTWAQFPAPAWLRWLGAALTAGMIPLAYWLFHTIGANISPSHTTRQDHRLITSGPYRYIRHPLYTFGGLAWLGLGLLATLWWVLLGGIAAFALIAYRTPKEEAYLLAEFGDEYRRYMARTGRYLPRFDRVAQQG